MFLKIDKLIFAAHVGRSKRRGLGRAFAIGLGTFALGGVLAFGLSPRLRRRVMDRFWPPKAEACAPGTPRCEGSPESAWEPEQDGDG